MSHKKYVFNICEELYILQGQSCRTLVFPQVLGFAGLLFVRIVSIVDAIRKKITSHSQQFILRVKNYKFWDPYVFSEKVSVLECRF